MKNNLFNLEKKITIGKAWRLLSKEFRQRKIENPLLDAKILAKYAFSLTDIELALKEQEIATSKQLEKLQQLGNFRLANMPIARILGKKEFYGLNFKLNKATLVPRPETELLVDLALKEIKINKVKNILELGVGSGAVLIAILYFAKNIKALGIDISDLAIKQAKENANLLKVSEIIEFEKSNWFEQIKSDEKFDLIISNPPYIKTNDMDNLSLEVKKYDPKLALDGGKDGLEPYRIIAKEARGFLTAKGKIIIEFGKGQEQKIAKIFQENGYKEINHYQDLAGIIRAMIIS